MEQRDEHILCVAGETFLTFGFDGTTMDAVAHAAHISKRTLYARYADKTVLFDAVLRDLIDRWLVSIEEFEASQGPLRDRLVALAHYLATGALTPQSVSVNRILICEGQRQPGFLHLAYEAGRKPAIRLIVSILRQHQRELRAVDLELSAEQFLSLAIDRNLRLAFLGLEVDADQWVHSAVDLFLTGIQERSGARARRAAPAHAATMSG